MSNRYYPPSIEESWESYRPHLKRKLEQIDYMAREMYRDMTYTRSAKPEKIREIMNRKFAELWEEVAAEQEDGRKRA